MNTVISKDGTSIAYNKFGSGPSVILVDGAFCSKDFGPMPKIASLLSQHFTVFTYDRRARGESGDTQSYSIEREFEDLEALINEAGGSSYLFAISSGAILSLHAVASGLNITKLALLEPPFVGNEDNKRPTNGEQQLKQLIAVGKKGKAVKFYLTKMIGVPSIIAFILWLTPNWRKMKANANSLPYDAAICGDFNVPTAKVALVKIPTIVIDSAKSPKILGLAVQSAVDNLPNARRITLKGGVHDVPAKVLVPALAEFYNS